MPLSSNKLNKLLRISTNTATSKTTEINPLEVLLQISLPLVLILALVVFTKVQDIQKFMDEFKRMAQTGELLPELEKHKLIAALEKVKLERRKYYGIDNVKIKGVNIQAGNVVDSDFKNTCKKTVKRLNTESLKRGEAEFLYYVVLDSANIHYELGSAGHEFVHRELDGFINGLINEVVQIQYKCIETIFEYFLANPDKLDEVDPKLRDLRKNWELAPDTDKPLYIKELYYHLVEKLQLDLTQRDYTFLDKTWQLMYR